MGRWEPNAQGRLEVAALELYSELGFEQTTVAEIAKRAGLTERTFFRYFADKREVLFSGAAHLQELLVSTLRDAPNDLSPLDATALAIHAAAERLQSRAEFSAKRQLVIAANVELQERELIKLATLSAALAQTLRDRGVSEPAASLTAEAGIAVFKIGFEQWHQPGEARDFIAIVEQGFDEVRRVGSR